jgi:ligand-binding sensor domain-containing protein/class 3 adenylate cyclase
MNKPVINKVLLVCFCFLSVPSFSQNFPGDYVSRVWTAADGLPGNTITDIIQDRNGYMYIGTYDGLVRFDGFNFTILNKNTAADFLSVSARTIFEDSKGVLWVGSNDEGVGKIEEDKITMYTIKDGLPSNSIRDIVEDSSGNIWIGTASGVFYIDSEGEFHFPEGLDEFGEEAPLVVALYCDTAGRIWMLTSDAGGLYYYTSGTFVKMSSLPFVEEGFITAIGQDTSGAFWFGISPFGLIRYDEGESTVFKENTPFEDENITAIYCDHSGSMWFGTEHGMILYRDGQFFTYTEKEGLVDNNVKRILEDREGNIWIATDRGGVEKMSMGKFRTQNLPATVNCIAEDLKGYTWIGTDEGLFCFYKNQEVKNEITEICKGIRIRHIEIAENDDLLISAYSKLGQIRWNSSSYKNWTTAEGLAGNKVRVAIESSDGKLYVGTTTGLSVISPDGSIQNYSVNDGLNNNYIMCLFEDNANRIWIGTDGSGVNIMEDGKVVSSLTTEENLAGNVIFKIVQDKTGVFWICTGTGVSRYENGEIFNYTASSGLGTDSIFQMLIDYTDTVWMTSNRGISSISMSSLNNFKNGSIHVLDPKFFNKNDGLRSGGVTSTSLSMRDSLGRLWFTLVDGYAIYDPVKVKSNSTQPLVHIESVYVDEEKIPGYKQFFTIAPGTKRTDINFTGLSFISSEMIRFKYMLEGFDTKYCEPTTARTVSYTNLKPGKYTFKVMAANSDGIWCENPASIQFEQKPYLYQRPIFILLISILCITIIATAVFLRIRHMMAIQRQLEKMVEKKTEDLEIEKNKAQKLLLNILPEPIAERLQNQEQGVTIADSFDSVTVLFSDIIGFTEISASCTATEVVNALNDLFTLFDIRAKRCGIEKIKTIGDAYMACCGVPNENLNHAKIMIEFAKGMYEDLAFYNLTAKIPFTMRIGLNSGPVIAGVIGENKFIYDLWGDTVNVANRMESLCPPGKILVTDSVRSLAPEFCYAEESEYEVKGKGKMKAVVVSC